MLLAYVILIAEYMEDRAAFIPRRNLYGRKITAIILFAIAAFLWIAELTYLYFARTDLNLPINWVVFALFAVGLQTFVIPALIFSFPRDPLNPRRVLVGFFLIITAIFWSIPPLYEYLALYVITRADIRMLIFNYLLLVPTLGGPLVILLYWYFVRIIQKLQPTRIPSLTPAAQIALHKKLAYFPLVAGAAMVAIAAVGTLVGLLRASFQLMIPPQEIIKETINVVSMGLIAGILTFFVQGRLILPWLANLPSPGPQEGSKSRPPFPLRRKLALIIASLSIFAFVIYVPVSYKHAQIILGEQLFEQLEFRLKIFLAQEISPADVKHFTAQSDPYTVGSQGMIFAADLQGNIVTPTPPGFTHLRDIVHWDEVIQSLLSKDTARIISHYGKTIYLAHAPLGQYHIVNLAYESDFSHLLTPLVTKTIAVGAVFGLVFSIVGVLFIRGVAYPIARLVEASRAMISREKLKIDPMRTGDEIEILADEFTAMALKLREYEKGLERKIAERTAELTEANVSLKEKGMILERVLEEVKKVDEELARLNRAKSEFISMASHQLRTPLTVIKWHSKVIKNAGLKRLTNPQRRAFYQIQNSNERMIELINALLNISRIEMGALAIEPKPISINEEIVAAIKTGKTLAQEHKVKVGHQPLPEVTAQLDPNLISIILNNLLVNAIRYTPKGGQVTVALSQKGKNAIIAISDTGYGIPLAEQKNIFNKFFRASNAVEQETTGTGLGLYLTKLLTEMLGGEISFTSQPGKGTKFTVKLPRTGLKKRVGTKGLIPLNT